MKLYNTKTRLKEKIKPIKKEFVTLYTCGPTVYNFAHIGNFRTYVFEDLLKRTLKYAGFAVKHVMNITDIDDKTIAGALHEGKLLEAYTAPFTSAFFEDLETLNIEKADQYPCATDYIPQMIEMIQTLLKKGFAYKGSDESIYFSIAKFPNYGCLSQLKLDELKMGASQRVSKDEYDKENVADFTLWKSHDPRRDGQIFWESPFGKGRPGWHIECSAMAMNLLGETIDIHVGGVDNLFPHHENEIAQSEACTGKSFANMWLHSEHLLVDRKKMSKSLGNFYTLRDLIDKGYGGSEVRFMLLNGHYRTQLNFTLEGLNAARTSLTRLSDFIQRLRRIKSNIEFDITSEIQDARSAFQKALFDDLNISEGFAALFEFVRKINHLCDENKIGRKDSALIIEFLQELDTVLGCIPFEEPELDIPEYLVKALEKRQKAREEKNWSEADKQRDLIESAGFTIEDSLSESRLKKK